MSVFQEDIREDVAKKMRKIDSSRPSWEKNAWESKNKRLQTRDVKEDTRRASLETRDTFHEPWWRQGQENDKEQLLSSTTCALPWGICTAVVHHGDLHSCLKSKWVAVTTTCVCKVVGLFVVGERLSFSFCQEVLTDIPVCDASLGIWNENLPKRIEKVAFLCYLLIIYCIILLLHQQHPDYLVNWA